MVKIGKRQTRHEKQKKKKNEWRMGIGWLSKDLGLVNNKIVSPGVVCIF